MSTNQYPVQGRLPLLVLNRTRCGASAAVSPVCRIAVALLLSVVGLGWGYQDPQGEELDTARGTFQILQRQARVLEEELERLQGQRSSVVEKFEASEIRLALARQQVRVLEGRSAMLEKTLTGQSEIAAKLAAALATSRRVLRARARTLYRMGPLSYHRLLLGAETAGDVLAAYQLVTYIVARDRALILAAKQDLERAEAALGSVEQTRQQLQSVADVTAVTAERLREQQQERQSLLRQIDRETESKRQALEERRRTATNLEGLIARLQRAAATVVSGFESARGELPWPSSGPVTGNFGRRRHPIYDTYTLAKGIEIAAPAGSLVHAVFPGHVVFADWFTGYGLVVIIDHGGEFFSLYGHLQQVAVAVGDRVQANDRLGGVGDTGSLTGVNLYFEIREGADALNPIQWLRSEDR